MYQCGRHAGKNRNKLKEQGYSKPLLLLFTFDSLPCCFRSCSNHFLSNDLFVNTFGFLMYPPFCVTLSWCRQVHEEGSHPQTIGRYQFLYFSIDRRERHTCPWGWVDERKPFWMFCSFLEHQPALFWDGREECGAVQWLDGCGPDSPRGVTALLFFLLIFLFNPSSRIMTRWCFSFYFSRLWAV